MAECGNKLATHMQPPFSSVRDAMTSHANGFLYIALYARYCTSAPDDA